MIGHLAQVELPELHVYGRHAPMPLWGWLAMGVGVAAAAGILWYGIAAPKKRPKRRRKSRKRRRSGRRRRR
jgi:hypothetical protein